MYNKFSDGSVCSSEIKGMGLLVCIPYHIDSGCACIVLLRYDSGSSIDSSGIDLNLLISHSLFFTIIYSYKDHNQSLYGIKFILTIIQYDRKCNFLVVIKM